MISNTYLPDICVPYCPSIIPFNIGAMHIVPVHSRSILEPLNCSRDGLELGLKRKGEGGRRNK
jgi:hypothetical protein